MFLGDLAGTRMVICWLAQCLEDPLNCSPVISCDSGFPTYSTCGVCLAHGPFSAALRTIRRTTAARVNISTKGLAHESYEDFGRGDLPLNGQFATVLGSTVPKLQVTVFGRFLLGFRL